MNKKECVQFLLKDSPHEPLQLTGSASAPMNIALIKYWGKRNKTLNLPQTSSLSVSLSLSTTTEIELLTDKRRDTDFVILNGTPLPEHSLFFTRISAYLDLFRPSPDATFHINSINEMPTSAGLASSASGFAALALALNNLFGWNLPKTSLSILARLGSGSACRSIYPGFVMWQKGEREDGLDSHGVPLLEVWPNLCMSFIPVSYEEKPISSRAAMEQTVHTSDLYRTWPELVDSHLHELQGAIQERTFAQLGSLAERNALAMHATMMTAQEPILYWLPKTVEILHRVWQARKEGLEVYLTMDAGPNVKLLFEAEHQHEVFQAFPEAQPLNPVW